MYNSNKIASFVRQQIKFQKCIINSTDSNQRYQSTIIDKEPPEKLEHPFLETQYHSWTQDPTSVETCWDYFFQNSVLEASTSTPMSHIKSNPSGLRYSTGGGGGDKNIEAHLAVQQIIKSYQARGHLVADLDPLGITVPDRKAISVSTYDTPPESISNIPGISTEDLNKKFTLPKNTFIGGNEKELTLKDIISRLENIYCKHLGLEYMHINCTKCCDFLRQRFETPGAISLTKEEKLRTYKRLREAHLFETFLSRKFKSEKRFGLEGGDVFIPVMQHVIDVGAQKGVEKFVMSLAHRGRLNVLVNITKKPLDSMFAQFQTLKPEEEGSGDVKYHLGTATEIENVVVKKKIKLFVVANPSHLEVSTAVMLGKCRAEQFWDKDNGTKVSSMVVHGDAAFSGQGICYECFHLTDLPYFTTHGSIHIVINNQVGFTTDPRFFRSSRYCSDVGKVVQAPIFHCNGDDPESCIYAAKVAAEYRAKFKKDVVIDIICYRRNGHNEADEPMFTQPLMYTRIKQIKPVFEKYTDQLVKEGVISADEAKSEVDKYNKNAEEELSRAKQQTSFVQSDWIDSPWKKEFFNKPLKYPKTGVAEGDIKHVLTKFSTVPGGDFVHHKGIDRILNSRKKLIDQRLVDFPMGEAAAFGTLLKEGYHIRMTGQDVERGTFSHRHHVLHHQTKDKVIYNALQHLYPNQGEYIVSNSSLCEYAIVGFEHGYSMVNPNALVIWEAQFGDFSNVAQSAIDTYLSAGESKWTRQSGVVLNLPHGLDGMGPEHSSARLERFLQMSNEHAEVMPPVDIDFAVKQLKACNWIVSNPTTPASYFHLLRRQMHLPFRKVLINMSPKYLLRHPEARSSFDEMLEGSDFQRLLPDTGPASKQPDKVKKVVFCSGRVYYDFTSERGKKKLEDTIAICRLEQLSPFPFDKVKEICAQYPQAKLIWGQEEHKNQGAWNYVLPRFNTVLDNKRPVSYIGRDYAAAPATGNKWQHLHELNHFLADLVNA